MTSSAHRTISVVVPAVNEERYVGACLDSLAEQTGVTDVEVIVVDNNSRDATASVAHARGARVVFEPEPGVCWARQAGTQAARNDLVVSTDADTTFAPGWLARIEARFGDRPDLVAVAGPCRFVDAPWWGGVYTTLLFGVVALVYRMTGRVLYASATNIAFRREAWSGYDTSLTQGGDELDLLRRLRAHGKIAFDLGNPTYTSSRRLRRGLLYNAAVTCFYYYLLGYAVNRIAGRQVLGTAPEIREATPWARASWVSRPVAVRAWGSAIVAVLGVVVCLRLGLDLA
jgi:glycosyltransferase involved in cell wall biosynthesis